MIKVRQEAVYFGPNPFASSPVLVAGIELAGEPESLKRGCLQLRAVFPEWFAPESSVPDSIPLFVGQTVAGWALAALNEVRGFLHDAGALETAGGCRLWLGFHQPGISISALQSGLKAIAQAAESGSLDRQALDADLELLWRACRSHHPDYQAQVLMQAARAHDIPVLPFLPGSKYWQYGWGGRSRVFFETASNSDGYLGGLLQRSKPMSKMVFSGLGFPTPRHRLVSQPADLVEAAEAVGWPCVVKPVSAGSGKGVTAGICSLAALEGAFAFARKYTDEAVMVESFVPGEDHRLMVVGGSLVAAIRREASVVTGDGKSSIEQLIGVINLPRSENLVKSRYLRPVAIDQILEEQLARQGFGLATVLPPGEQASLRSNANLSTGGVGTDVTDRVHPHVRQMAESLASATGLFAVGIDYITTDISQSWQQGGALIEMNTMPGLCTTLAAGLDPVRLGAAVLGPLPGRIPLQLVLVSRAELETARNALQEMQLDAGQGWVCGAQAAIGGLPLNVSDAGAWSAVNAALRHRELRALCVVCCADEIVRLGMPVDRVEQVVLCGGRKLRLTEAWLQVLGEHSARLERFADWSGFAWQGALPMLAGSAGEQPGS